MTEDMERTRQEKSKEDRKILKKMKQVTSTRDMMKREEEEREMRDARSRSFEGKMLLKETRNSCGSCSRKFNKQLMRREIRGETLITASSFSFVIRRMSGD